MPLRPLVLAFPLGLLLTACSPRTEAPSPDALQGTLTITGSSTVAPVVSEIGKRFESLHPGVRVDVQTGGTSRGIADLRRGMADLGMASRALKESEAGLTGHRVAIDGVAMIVHRDLPVASLTDEQIAGLFTGAIRSWAEVGGPDAPPTVVTKAEGRATLELFLAYTGLEAGQIRADIVIGDNQQGIRTVAADRHAIGYVSIGTAVFEAERGTPIRPLPMRGVEPSLAAVREGRFPLARPLLVVSGGDPSPLARAFIAFAVSPAVHDLIEAQHVVPVAN